jgi:hypothetical protein
MFNFLLFLNLFLGIVDLQQTLTIPSGYTEGNFILRPTVDKPAVLVTIKLGTDSAITYGLYKFEKKHKKAAYVIVLSLIVARVVIVTHNARIVKQ